MNFDKSKVYKPFSNYKKMKKILNQHRAWIKDKLSGQKLELVFTFGNLETMNIEILVGNLDLRLTPEDLFKNYVFADDDSPCGELVEAINETK